MTNCPTTTPESCCAASCDRSWPISATVEPRAIYRRPADAAETARAWSSIAAVGRSPTPILAVDLRNSSRTELGGDLHDAFLRSLEAPPWVTVAVVDPQVDRSLHDLVTACDIVLGASTDLPGVVDVDDPVAELAHISAAVQASPQAAVALVQLLRLTHQSPVLPALHAESLTYAVLQTGATYTQWLEGRGSQPARINDAAEDAPEAAVVEIDRQGGLLTITLDRVAKRNALNVAMRDELTEALELLDADASLDGAILRGRGPNFCAGGDLDEFGTTPTPAIGHYVRSIRSLPALIHRVRDRLRVRVHGSCVGAGIELPAFAHSVVADPNTTFRLPEIGFGLVPGAGGSVSITRRCGRHRAAWWAISGRTLDAPQALRWNIIDRIEAEPTLHT